jgi:hypothetical protein
VAAGWVVVGQRFSRLPARDERRGKLGGQMNILNEKFDFQLSTNIKLLRRI